MTSYLTSTRDFLYRRRRPFIIVGGVVGGVYMAASYAVSKFSEMQTRMVEERRDKENLKRRFAQNQEDCTFTILALLPTLGDQLFANMDVEGLTAKLQRGRQSPSGPGSSTPAVTVNGTALGHVQEGIAPAEQPSKQTDSTHSTLEAVWSKVEQEKGNQTGEINGIVKDSIANEATSSDIVKIEGQSNANEDDVTATTPKAGGKEIEERSSLLSASPSGLDAVSEPPPAPISAEARLSPSPAHTPAVEMEENALRTANSADNSNVTSHEYETKSDSTVALTNGHHGEPSAPTTAESEPVVAVEDPIAEKKQKLALWNELKITAFSRTITTIYSLVLLSLQTHIQLNLLGRYAYLTSVASLSGPAPGSGHRIRLERNDGLEMEEDEVSMQQDEEDLKGIDMQTERLYLTFSWWFLHEGWKELAEDVKESVQDVFGGLALKTQLTHQDFLLLINKVRRRVEYETREDGFEDTADGRSEWSQATGGTTTTAATGRRRGKRKTFLSVLFPPESEEVSVLEKAGAIAPDPSLTSIGQLTPTLVTLLDETKDLLESKDFARILRLCLNRVFDVFEATLRPTFGVEPPMTSAEVDGLLRQSSAAAAAAGTKGGGLTSESISRFQQLNDDEQDGVRVRLASLFPAVARQSSAAINGVPNQYVDSLSDIKELKAFSAVIYSSWS